MVPVHRAFGPASLSNLGPGFDTLGLCIRDLGDVVEARWADGPPGARVAHIEGDHGVLPRHPLRNTAARAAQAVLDRVGEAGCVELTIEKRMPIGSGIGSSSASAVAGAVAANLLLGEPLAKDELVEAVLHGEEAASGALHGDNVLPALLGGLVIVSASEPTSYRRVPLPGPLPIALFLPDIEVLTREARAILPAQVPLYDAVRTASALAFLIDAFRCGDWEAVGRAIMQDRLVEPTRAALVPCYTAVRSAALEAGALGCALSGSGPALFAVAADTAACAAAADAMRQASEACGVGGTAYVTAANLDGAGRFEAD